MTMDTPGQWAGGLRAWGDASLGAGYRASGRAASARPRVPGALGRPRPARRGVVPVRQAHDQRRLPDDPQPRRDGPSARVAGRPRHPRRRARPRDQQSGGRLAAGGRGPAGTCDSMLSSLADLAERSITPSSSSLSTALRRELADRQVSDDGALGRMDREDAVGDWLTPSITSTIRGSWRPCSRQPAPTRSGSTRSAAVTGPEALCACTALGGVDHQRERVCSGELTDTTNRISNLVGAVRSYSQLDRTSLHQVDVHEGIDSTLDDAGGEARRRRRSSAPSAADVVADRRLRRRAQPGVDQPDRQRHRRDGRCRDAADIDAPRRSARDGRRHDRLGRRHAAPTCRRGSSSRSSPPRTWARAPASASTSPDASSSSAITATSRSTPARERPRRPSGSP